jgi:hypothetical protein
MVFDITSSREPCLALRPVTRGRRDPWYNGDAGRPNPRLPVDSQRPPIHIPHRAISRWKEHIMSDLAILPRLSLRLCGAAVFLCLGGVGCLINSGSEKVVESDAKRLKVDFETEDGLSTFQRTVRQRYEAGGGVVGTSGFAIPFVVAVGEKRVLSENAYYNGEVAKADANGDGKISDAEARAYAQ